MAAGEAISTRSDTNHRPAVSDTVAASTRAPPASRRAASLTVGSLVRTTPMTGRRTCLASATPKQPVETVKDRREVLRLCRGKPTGRPRRTPRRDLEKLSSADARAATPDA